MTDAAQVADVVGRADAAPRDLVAPAPGAGPLAPDCAPPAPGDPVPLSVCEPLPSVPALPLGGDEPPLRTVLLAWMIAWRKGCTPNETLATSATTASTPTGRSQPTSTRGAVRPDRTGPSRSSSPGRGRRRSRGNGSRGTRASAPPAGAGRRGRPCPAPVPGPVPAPDPVPGRAEGVGAHGEQPRPGRAVADPGADPLQPVGARLDPPDGLGQAPPQRLLHAALWCGHAVTSPPWSAAS